MEVPGNEIKLWRKKKEDIMGSKTMERRNQHPRKPRRLD